MTDYRRHFLAGAAPPSPSIPQEAISRIAAGISEKGHSEAQQADGFRKSSTHPGFIGLSLAAGRGRNSREARISGEGQGTMPLRDRRVRGNGRARTFFGDPTMR